MTAAYSLIVGARGWDHAGWHGIFYPDDLPVDWRLSYYANEFAGVLVPEAVWRAADPVEIKHWCGDVADGFLFFLETAVTPLPDRLNVVYRDLFEAHWGGVPLTEAVMSNEEKWDLRQLRERFTNLRESSRGMIAPGFFLAGEPPDIDRLREAKLLAELL
ncbi:MAG: hypothetical protein KDI18_00590 [Gammaproteobacteria bacterium]|nr:hypothetical protein [Gammaproteobacteria bacterium]